MRGMGEAARSRSASSAGRIMPASLSVGERCPRGGAGRDAAAETAMIASRGAEDGGGRMVTWAWLQRWTYSSVGAQVDETLVGGGNREGKKQ